MNPHFIYLKKPYIVLSPLIWKAFKVTNMSLLQDVAREMDH